LAGYTAINASAFCAAVEFGIQPLLFKDPRGAPLYAPYPLSIAIPAMMIGHLSFAGLAELVLSGGVVAYLQRANPAMLKRTAPGALPGDEEVPHIARQGAWSTLRPLWTALALLLILTPLGTLAGGAAWGEWGARDFSQAAARRRIAAVSRNMSPPPQAPQGLERLYAVWTAPFPQYAPAFVRRPALGYLLSAMFGSGVIILGFLIVSSLLARGGHQTEVDPVKTRAGDA
jgi:cobalt/nickel transport system permease protein